MPIKFELKEASAVRRELHIEVAADRVERELDHVLDEVARGARLPGFRQGKVPRSLLRKRFAREIENELLEHLVPAAVEEALRATALRPIHRPVIKDVHLVDAEPLRFVASFEVRPPIEARDYRGVVLHPPEAKIEDGDVARELEAMRQAAAQYEPVGARALERGDFALVDLRTGEGSEAREQQGALIEVGGEEYHPDFARALEGMSPGEERSFTVRYGEDDPDPRARGREVHYQVRVKEVKRKVVPDLDDEFAKDTGRFASLAELKDAVRRDLEGRLERERRRHLERQLSEALATPLQVEVPQALLEGELDRMVEEQARLLMLRGIDVRTAPIDWRATRDRLRDEARLRVKWELLLEAIADKEQIEVAADELDARLAQIAEGSKKSVEFVRSKIEKDGRMEELRATIRLEKAIDFLLRNARMERR